MKPQAIKCPSCGATHDILNPGVVKVVCAYYGSHLDVRCRVSVDAALPKPAI